MQPRLSRGARKGDRLGQWVLVRQLGNGGNADVWLASNGNIEAAIKRPRPPFQGDRLPRFRKEIEVLRLVRDERGVLPLIDACATELPPWYAMPAAERLLDRLGGTPTVEDVVECVRDISAVLERIIARWGVSHRDIKPDNLFWYQGAWAVGDFGLATRADDDNELTRTGGRLGPVFYMAPEMLLDASRADAGPADVYSLAKCLWRLLSEQHYPLPGEIRVGVEQMRLRSWVVHPRIDLLDPIIECSTQHSPEMRPTMAELHAELQTWLHPPLITPGAPGNVALLRRQIEDATAPEARHHDEHMAQVRAMNEALRRLEGGARSVEARLRGAGWDQVAVAPGGPETIYNVPPVNPRIGRRFAAAHSSGGFAVGISAPGGQPPHLYGGIGVQVDRRGRQYLVAKYVITEDHFSHGGEVLWMDEALVIPGTEQAKNAEGTLTHGLLSVLEGALVKYRDRLTSA